MILDVEAKFSIFLGGPLRQDYRQFQRVSTEFLTSMDLFKCKQNQGEALRDYFQRFVQLKVKAPNVPKDVTIEAVVKGLRIEAFAAHLA